MKKLLFIAIIIICRVFLLSVFAQETQTTLYFNSYCQKYLETNEVTKFYPIPSGTAFRKDGNLYFVYTDHLGSSTVITGADGNEIGRISYYPYGSTLDLEGEIPTEKKFTGQVKDDSTELYYYVARYYDPETGHFISADILGRGNKYSYANNNPLIFTGPSGHMVIADGGRGNTLQYEISGLSSDTAHSNFINKSDKSHDCL